MNKQKAQELLAAIDGSSWAKEFTAFVEMDETRLLSEDPGKYSVSDLLSETNIRKNSMRNADIQSIGVAELQSTLEKLPREQVVQNYVLKSSSHTGIIYLDESGEELIGVALIEHADTA